VISLCSARESCGNVQPCIDITAITSPSHMAEASLMPAQIQVELRSLRGIFKDMRRERLAPLRQHRRPHQPPTATTQEAAASRGLTSLSLDVYRQIFAHVVEYDGILASKIPQVRVCLCNQAANEIISHLRPLSVLSLAQKKLHFPRHMSSLPPGRHALIHLRHVLTSVDLLKTLLHRRFAPSGATSSASPSTTGDLWPSAGPSWTSAALQMSWTAAP
jgi:hypothetical protein